MYSCIFLYIKNDYMCGLPIALWNHACACPVIQQVSHACAWSLEHRSVARQKCLLVQRFFLVMKVGPM